MVDCVCGYGKDISDDQTECPICNLDITPLHRLRSLPLQYYEMGVRLSEKGHVEEAIERLITAISLNYTSAKVYQALGNTYIQKGKYDEAVKQFEKALEIDPRSVEVRSSLTKAKEIMAKVKEDQARETHKTQVSKKILAITLVLSFIVGGIMAVVFTFIIQKQNKTKTIDYQALLAEIKKNIANYSDLRGINLDVTREEKNIRIIGVVPTSLHKALVIEVARNVVDDRTHIIQDLKVIPTIENPEELTRDSYTVKSGDSLSTMAYKLYGDAQKWTKIYEANKSKLNGPHDVSVGQVLLIPPK